MSDRTSLPYPSVNSISTEFHKSDFVNIAHSQEIWIESLESHIQRCKGGNEPISWTRLMEWFVEAVIAAALFRKEHPSAPPLTNDNIQIDSSSTILIAFPSSPHQPSISGSLSSDIPTLCTFFLHIHRTLKQHKRLILPLDPEQKDMVFTRIMVTLIKHFVASGDLVLPNSSPTDHSHDFVLTDHSFLRGYDVDHSEHFLDAVKRIKESTSMETVRIIHHLLTPPPLTSFPWDNRQSFQSNSFYDTCTAPDTSLVDQIDKFDCSLFDETDDEKLVASLHRCRHTVKATQSTKCIVDIPTFRTLLISGLHSSTSHISFECGLLFFTLADLLPTVDDPRDSAFQSLRSAFRDGTLLEKLALLDLWVRFFRSQDRGGHVQMMIESDFDFEGFLDADLRDTSLINSSCYFVVFFFVSDQVSMSQRWKLDFLLKFEKRHRMMSRLFRNSNLLSRQEQSGHNLRTLSITLGSLLSIFRGCDFPSTLTELIAADEDPNSYTLSNSVYPAFFLNHTSIAPNHRHSFFPMDLMFERFFRFNPNALLEGWSDLSLCTPRQFLHAPYVGLHSLLLRCPELTLNQQMLPHLLGSFITSKDQDTIQNDILTLFQFYPPPRLFDTLFSSPHLVRATVDLWVLFLALFSELGAFTAPFGACSFLAKLFKMLIPFDWKMEQVKLDLLNLVGDVVVFLHWLSFPAHFDSPLLCHLPSLAGAQRGVLQTLSSHSGIPSLVPQAEIESYWHLFRLLASERQSFNDEVRVLSFAVRHSASEDSHCYPFIPIVVKTVTEDLLLPIPSFVSIAFEFFLRFVSVASDDVRMELVTQGLLDHIFFAVSNSSFLDDYEKAVSVIGILLATIRRANQTNAMREFDFYQP
ncbi:hypothetical protein BLNAU_19553 [Blattamonas nauphoetae]|uniref:Uncharacterized protein n=1 Tax=Blattamonas nauphoetae TaxID=2049346 RepID=A0ABQ9X193_9EUKA|nr:hypothetical protein BLNAU_19553 [Blattamonas nauphoetae]